MTTRALVAVLLLSASLAAQPEVPATPAGRVLGAWLAAFNSGDAATIREFDSTYRRDTPPLERTLGLRERTGGFALLRIEKSEPTTIVALLQEKESDTIARLEVSVTADEPPRIVRSPLRVVTRPDDLAIPRMPEANALAALATRVDELAARDRFSGVVLVARNGKVLLQKTAGLADREARTPVTADTRFRIGSMNKMFTSVATLKLVEAGKLALDDPLGKHLTDHPNKDVASKVTVRHLLTHTGGTGDIFGPEFTKNRLILREHADYLRLYGERSFGHEPGAEFRYSNYGFVLLGAIIERVTGLPYYDAARRSVFQPAGMTATDSLPETDAVEHRSAGYMRRNGALVSNADTLPWRGTAAGGGYSTAADLLRFAQALEAGKLISKTMLAEATTPRLERYGFGITGDGTLRYYGHNGGAPGMNGDLRIYPELGLVLAALSNLDPPAASRLADFFALRMPAASYAMQQSTRSPAATAPAPPPGTDIWLTRLTGTGIQQPINITSRPGYDNQPSFTPDGKGILFTRSDGKQTDIYLYDFTARKSAATQITNTPESEYSPTVTPDGQGISVIRVEADGTQRLWRFARDGQNPAVVLRDVKRVGYHAWGPDGQLALFVLGANQKPNTLQVANSRTGRARIVAGRIGRSIHRIPGRETISVLHIEGDARTIKEFDVKTRTLKPIVRSIATAEGDYAWTPDGAILMSDGKALMMWKGRADWTKMADLSTLGLQGASRMSVSPDGKWLALVVPDQEPETRD